MTGPDLAPALTASLLWARAKKIQQRKMMTNSKAIVTQQRPGALAATGPLTDWEVMRSQADELLKSGFLPKSIRTPEQAIAIMQTGKELGLGPMQSLRGIHVIDGKPAMSADLIAGLALARVPGSTLRVAESTNTICRVEAARAGQELTPFSFSMDDARNAGLTGKDVWRKYPRAMLRARCLTEACRAVFPDVVMGLYSPEELEDSSPGQVVDVQSFREGREEAPSLSLSPHSDSREEGTGDADLYRDLCGRFATIEADLETCDSWDKVCAIRGLLGTRAQQSDLTRTMQQKAESGDITPSQRQELGKTWMRCNRKTEKLEKELAPPLEASFEEPAVERMREPGEDDE